MKVIKNINNNVAICLDSNGLDVVVFAKGIGFKKPPYEIDVSEIQRSFYDVNPSYIEMMANADEDIINIATEIKRYSDEMNIVTSSNLLFSLIDHITFAIQRSQEGVFFNLLLSNDISHLYPNEMKIGKYAVDLIYKVKKIRLPKEEAAYIAMNIINSEREVSNKQASEEKMINDIVKIIEDESNITIDRESVSYSRFESHMRYLLKVRKVKEEDSLYPDLLETVKNNYKEDFDCALKVRDCLKASGFGPFSNDDVLFLTIHINKLRTRYLK